MEVFILNKISTKSANLSAEKSLEMICNNERILIFILPWRIIFQRNLEEFINYIYIWICATPLDLNVFVERQLMEYCSEDSLYKFN